VRDLDRGCDACVFVLQLMIATGFRARVVLFACIPALVTACGGNEKSVADDAASGVGLVQDLDCRGRPLRIAGHAVSGSGFLVGSRVVMTAEHGIWVGLNRRACGLRVRLSGSWYDVSDVKVWSEHGESDRRGTDLATLTLSRPARGHVFEFAGVSERVGSSVSALGYPLGGPLKITRGPLARKTIQYGKPTLAAKIAIEGGNSGGPIINRGGRVLSVVSRIVVYSNLSPDRRNWYGGVDLPRWWPSAHVDLCRTYPRGGIPDCGAPSTTATRTPIDIPGP
jgi:hypothetical protein